MAEMMDLPQAAVVLGGGELPAGERLRLPANADEPPQWVPAQESRPGSGDSKASPAAADEEQKKAAKARQAAALERMRAQQAEFAQREASLAHVWSRHEGEICFPCASKLGFGGTCHAARCLQHV